jgi:hypothetical protein
MPNDFTHAYCNLCKTIQLVTRESLEGEDSSESFKGGDILCTVCQSILLTVYVPKRGAAGAFFLSVLKSRRWLSKCAELQRELEATKRKMEYYQINLARVDLLKNRELNALKAELAKLKA